MKIRVYSDLHLEFGPDASRLRVRGEEDLVVLAGDIALGVRGVKWARVAFPHVPVVYVLGNHEFYGHAFDTLVDECKAAAHGSNVRVLERDALDILGIRILGCTLWTDFKLLGEERAREAEEWARNAMNDYRVIRLADESVLTTERTVKVFEQSAAWLDQQIAAADRPVLVVTHFAPTEATASPVYKGSISNASFHSNLDRLIRPPVKLWIHGHTHSNVEAQVNGVCVTSNQLGYPRERTAGFRVSGIFEFGD